MRKDLSPMKLRRDAEPLRPAELIQVRKVIARPVVPDFMDPGDVARKLALERRTVLQLAKEGAFDCPDLGEFFRSWKPAENRVRVPVIGVQRYLARRPASV